MTEYNWSLFIVRIPINAPSQELYDAWTTRKGMEHWFLRMAEFKTPDGQLRKDDEHVQRGDTYTWRWYGWSDDIEEHGKILLANGHDYFQFKFGEAGICTVNIKQEQGYNIVELVQSDIPTDEEGMHYYHLGCKTGWTFHLTNMKSIFEGGADLRNKDLNIHNVINA
jgi:uncharacterized protein YndB with AHSA1/START domain